MAFLNIIILAINLISILITFPGFMFILVVNILDWIKNKKLDISDQLISGISLFILIHRVLQVSLDLVVITGFHSLLQQSKHSINILYLSVIFCTLLFSTFLAIHFCLKIVNSNHKVYAYIQRGFPEMFPRILLPSVFASILISAPAAVKLTEMQLQNLTYTLPDPGSIFVELFPYFTPYVLLSSFCLFLFFGSAVNIILSLRRHVEQIHNNSEEFRSGIVEAHVTAMKKVICLLAFNIFYYALQIFIVVIHLSHRWHRVYPSLYALCHVLGLVILIRGSRKLLIKLQFIWLNCFHLDKALNTNSAAKFGN
ncbi:taste receptor type 2 member 8-like [Phyllobates terribilis]|uniref:taste receptor type 2 member 8-like n=1 Tax=Phyllobates terribilis TaxID=111132 RepID=UPI003CCAC7C1